MKDTLVTFETAKLAKEVGFDIPLIGVYIKDGNIHTLTETDILPSDVETIKNIMCNAPTQSLLQKWLREKHYLIVIIYPLSLLHNGKEVTQESLEYTYQISIKGIPKVNITVFDNYEEALEEGLRVALNLIKK